MFLALRVIDRTTSLMHKFNVKKKKWESVVHQAVFKGTSQMFVPLLPPVHSYLRFKNSRFEIQRFYIKLEDNMIVKKLLTETGTKYHELS